jgi:serine/threonine-protein kinase RsbW
MAKTTFGLRFMASERNVTVRLSIESRLDQIPLISTCLRGLCQHSGLSDMDAYQVQTAVIEAVNNAIIHACGGESGHDVVIYWHQNDAEIEVEICDTGQHVMQEMPANVPPSSEAESGRGWWIMRQWMDSVEYVSDDALNRVIMKRKLPMKEDIQ